MTLTMRYTRLNEERGVGLIFPPQKVFAEGHRAVDHEILTQASKVSLTQEKDLEALL